MNIKEWFWNFFVGPAPDDPETPVSGSYTQVELALDRATLGSYVAVWKKHRLTYKTTWTFDAFIDLQAGLMDEMIKKTEEK